MNRTRRQLLNYFGLGIGGAIATAHGLHRNASVSASPPDQPLQLATRGSGVSGLPLPEFQGISNWLNSSPLTVAGLQGKVVAVQFWTFACINSQRTLPYVTSWYEKYANRGLEIVGVHTPEFDFEHNIDNVRQALKERGITYPIAIDNQRRTWRAYRNRYWPHLFLANRNGIMMYNHIGEGAYNETEQMIKQLLGEDVQP